MMGLKLARETTHRGNNAKESRPQGENSPLTARSGDAVEPVAQVVLITMVTGGAEVIVGALRTFPSDPNDGLLPTGVTHGAIMLDSCNMVITRMTKELTSTYIASTKVCSLSLSLSLSLYIYIYIIDR